MSNEDIRHALRRFTCVGLLLGLACFGFTSVGAGVLAVLHSLPDVHTEAGQTFKLAVKAVIFAILAAGCLYACVRISVPEGGACASRDTEPTRWPSRALLCLALALAAALAFPNLGALPSLQPDETHHLTVARNIAFYGKYASGNPVKGFNYRDPYDSVGPTVLLPVAGAFRTAHEGVVGGRAVVGVFYLVMCVAFYGLFRPVFGATASALGLLFVQCSFGSVYLARTLYGEVPALAFLVGSLYLWRRALRRPGKSWAGFGAGICLALMVDCKAFLFISVWGIAAACLYDRLALRRIRWPHLMWPAMGFGATIVTLHLAMSGAPASSEGGLGQTLAYYEHYLMFGFVSVTKTLAWMASRPLELGAAALALAAATALVVHRRYDPPLAALLFTAPLLAYWWVFFTPGNIPRYMFYTCAVGGMFAGTMAWRAFAVMSNPSRSARKRIAAGALGVALICAAFLRCWPELKSVYVTDEMRDDRALAAYVMALPQDTSIGTTHWPLEKLLDLLANRQVTLINSTSAPPSSFSVVIAYPPTDAQSPRPALRDKSPDATIGRYVVIRNANPAR